ncbi:MAG: hypothetical protein JNN32_03055 [Flavobacteriales bacterium]|nr:hypothetical protein [Flavobacteriales bacterium]
MDQVFLISLSFFISCAQPPKQPAQNLTEPQTTNHTSKMTLLENVKLAINPKFEDWVLFKHGTYIIFDNADTISDVQAEAIRLMKEFGPVYAGSPAGDFGVTHLNKTEGWVVSGHGYGMYTYVNPSELETKSPTDIEIGTYGRSKRQKDGDNPVIVHINKKK